MRTRRGPLSGASAAQLAALRALVVAYRDWERSAGTPAQTLGPKVPAAGRHLSLPSLIEDDILLRTNARLAARPDAAAIAARHDELSGKRPIAGTIALAGIHEELTRIRVLLEVATAHGEDDRKDIL